MPTWMVVEDEPDIYDVLLAMFEIWGIEGVAFVDGAEAIAWVNNVDQGRVRGELPELAILDIRLPEVSGPDVGHRLRQSPVLGDMAVVLITAYRVAPDEEEEAIARAQADLLMYKPLPAMAELREKMDGVIAKHSKPKAVPVGAPLAEEEPETEPETEPDQDETEEAVPEEATPAPTPAEPEAEESEAEEPVEPEEQPAADRSTPQS